MRVPFPWAALARYWHLPPALVESSWRAFSRSRWHRPSALRRSILLFECVHIDSTAFLEKTCAPAELVAAIEDLVRERRLPRATASALEECILAKTSKEGGWK
jgi:hypothetical protein